MKKRLILTLAMALMLAAPAMAENDAHEVCSTFSSFAETVMTNRQNMVPVQALEALLGQRGEPDWHTGKQRENAITALRERLGEKE